MSTAIQMPSEIQQERIFTEADLAALPDELPSGTVLYELDNGRLITMTPPGDLHGAVEGNFIAELKLQGERKGLGKARGGDAGIVLWRDPDRVVGADAAFIRKERLPVRRSKEGYLETIPDLIVEVKSKNDRDSYIQKKVQDYLAAGVKVVWLADPYKRTVTVHRPEQTAVVLGENDTLTVEDIIPGLTISIKEVFAD